MNTNTYEKEFSQKSHYDKHQKKKNPCIYKNKLVELIEEVMDNKINNNKPKTIKIKIMNKPKKIKYNFIFHIFRMIFFQI